MTQDDTILSNELPAKLRQAREFAGLSQGQTARLLSISRPTISEIEAGRRRVTAEELATFADTYGVDVDWLLGRSEVDAKSELQLVARKLAALSPEDIGSLIEMLQSLKKSSGTE